MLDKRRGGVFPADAVAIAIGTQACVEFSGEHRLPQGFDVRLDRLGMYAPEARVARAANFVAGDAITPEEFDEQARGPAMHDIGDEAKARLPPPLPIDQFFECIKIKRPRLPR